VSLADDVQPVFTSSCATAGCHVGAGAPDGLDLSAGVAYGNMADVASIQLPSMDLIEPGDPDNSYLVRKIEGTQTQAGGLGGRMPAGTSPLSQEIIDMIRVWVEEGATDN